MYRPAPKPVTDLTVYLNGYTNEMVERVPDQPRAGDDGPPDGRPVRWMGAAGYAGAFALGMGAWAALYRWVWP